MTLVSVLCSTGHAAGHTQKHSNYPPHVAFDIFVLLLEGRPAAMLAHHTSSNNRMQHVQPALSVASLVLFSAGTG